MIPKFPFFDNDRIRRQQRNTVLNVAIIIGGVGVVVGLLLVYAPLALIIGLLLAAVACLALNQGKFVGDMPLYR